MKISSDKILITGGATGIGFALARRFAGQGNSVIICGRRQEALAEAQAAVPSLITRVCDIASQKSRQDMVAWLKANHPDLNVVINNAAVQFNRNLREENGYESIDREVTTNFTAPVQLIGEVLPLLTKQRKQAIIVNVGSGLAFVPQADVPVYCATKAAIHSFTLSLRHQLKSLGIRVVEMAPPIVETGLGNGVRSKGVAGQQIMSPEDFALEAIGQLENGQDEILVGLALATRKQGEALFERMNSFS